MTKTVREKVTLLCIKCEEVKPHFVKKTGNHMSICVECRTKYRKQWYNWTKTPETLAKHAEEERVRRKRIGPLRDRLNPREYYVQQIYCQTSYRAKKLGLDFDLTKDWIRSRLDVCAVSNLPFSFDRPNGTQRNPLCPSIDRIDSSLGYTQTNCELVHSWYNVAKNEYLEENIIVWMKFVIENHPRHGNSQLSRKAAS